MTPAEIAAEFNAPPSRERLERWQAGLLSGEMLPPSGVSLEEALRCVGAMLATVRGEA